jgi:ATPase family AAA domain-containing protein 2
VKRELPELPVAPPDKEPEGPTKEQIKAQKKQDRHTLNLLKLQIQPIMEQIKMKYKKFRNPVIEESQIAYLFEEQDLHTLTTDLTEEQRAEQNMYRPYEIDKDRLGEPGLREVATGRFYYNVDIVVIERRLSNGYYKRPQDFLADIKRLAKDAATSGDADRTLKANELRANVEVDMQMIETNMAALTAECELVYQREKAREKVAAENAKKAAQSSAPDSATTAVPTHMASQSLVTESTGPLILGEVVPGRDPVPPLTPKNQHFEQSFVSNGEGGVSDENSHAQSNGDSVPSRPIEDVVMEESQVVQGESTQGTRLFTPGGLDTQPRSQQSGIQRMAPGTQPTDYQNSASTTTSGQKTSDRSNRTSDRSNFNNTQSTNGAAPYPDFSGLPAMSGGSQIPDTQGRFPLVHNTMRGISSSFDSLGSNDSDSLSTEAAYPPSSQHTGSQSSQPFALPPLPASVRQPPNPVAQPVPIDENHKAAPTAITSLLNASGPATLVLDEATLSTLHDQLVKRTSGLSVEQLEQVNATLMDAVWSSRMKWNRNAVIANVEAAFNAVIADVEEMQKVLDPTQEKEGAYAPVTYNI